MTKSRRKLALCTETIRMLSRVDIARVIGGIDKAVAPRDGGSHDPVCPTQFVAPRE